MAVVGFPSSDHKWAYSAIIDMLNDRDAPLPDNPVLICGFTGLSKRRWTQVRDFLMAEGYLIAVGNGYLSNPRFEEEREARSAEHERSVENGRRGGLIAAQGRAAPEIKSEKTARKRDENAAKIEDNLDLNGQEPQKTVGQELPPPQPTRARLEARIESNTTHPITTEVVGDGEGAGSGSGRDEPALGRLEDADLGQLYDAVAEASGHNPSSPDQINRAYGFVEKWRKAGISFDLIVIPSIRAMVAESSEPTRTLGRFDARISHEHARAAAKGKTGKPYTPPPSPELIVSGEDAMFRPLRKALLDRLGPRTFATYVNRVRFEDVGEQPGGRHPIKVVDPMPGGLGLMDADRAAIVRACAKALGFTEVW